MARLSHALALALLLATAGALKFARVAPTQKEVDAVRAKLANMSTVLGGLLHGEGLAHSKVAPALKLFSSNLRSVLDETSGMKPEEAMPKLLAAKAGVAGLVSAMTKTQESLMKENVEQQESLLMGVLMTHQKESIEEQLAILKSSDFDGLDVTKALLRAKDNKTPLYIQAARFLDAHKNASGSAVSHVAKANRSAAQAATAASLERRVQSLEKEEHTREMHFKKKMDDMGKLLAKGGNNTKVLKAIMKREQRRHLKWSAMQKHDIESMRAAADAVRKGDMKALGRARAALQASLSAMKDKNAGMVVLLQQGHMMLERDCPYCVAQCVEKCHNQGKPYVTCLSDCADSGQ